mgnify:CR=1 FL=1
MVDVVKSATESVVRFMSSWVEFNEDAEAESDTALDQRLADVQMQVCFNPMPNS